MSDYSGASTVTLAAATATQILPKRQKDRRVSYSVSNTGANVAYIVPSDRQIAVAGQGIELLSGGATFDSDGGDYKCWSGGVSAISTAGTTLSIWERVRS